VISNRIFSDNENDKTEENQVIEPIEDSTSTANETETTSNPVVETNETETTSNPVVETNEPIPPPKPADEETYEGDTVEENPKPSQTTAVVSPDNNGKQFSPLYINIYFDF
jgi:hypothetical protein